MAATSAGLAQGKRRSTVAGVMNKANIGPAIAVVAVAFVTVFSMVQIADANGRAAAGLEQLAAETDRLAECRFRLQADVVVASAKVQSAQTQFIVASASGAGAADARASLDAAEAEKGAAQRALEAVDTLCYRR